MGKGTTHFIIFLCWLDNLILLSGAVYLVGWRGWNKWTFLAYLFMSIASSPSLAIKAIRKALHDPIN